MITDLKKTTFDYKETILNRLDIKAFYASQIPSIKWNSTMWGQGLCPFHEDVNPSFFANKETGNFHCKGCNKRGSPFDFYMEKHSVDFKTALNDLAKEAGLTTTEPQRRIVKTYDYVDESGNLIFQTVRYEPKDFRQRKPDGKGGWIWNLKDVRLVLYNLSEVIKSESILIVEGEKDCNNLQAIGLIATCNPMGAGKWRPDYNQYFQGKKVVIIPDNDKPGRDHAQTIAKNLKGIAESVKVIERPGLPEKGDVSDWLRQEHTKEELIEFIETSPEWEEPEDKENIVSFLKKGSDLIDLECHIEWIVDRLVPKQSHGRGGIGKTWISLILANAISKGIPFMDLSTQAMPVTFTDFENSLPVLVERVKKMGASEVWFWHNTNEVKPPKLDKEEGEQYKSLPIGLLIFDTLRASQGKDENDSKDMSFILSRLKELRDIGFTILLLHHTPKSNDRTYKGSTAIIDLADHVLSLHKVKRGSLEDIDDEDEEGYYRLGTKEKTRYEPFHIFLDFDPDKGFVIAPDPDEEDMRGIHSLIIELKNPTGELPIQGQILNKTKEELNLSNLKTRKLLNKGEGKYWNSAHIPDRKNAKVYEPISVCQFVTPIYTQQTNKLPSQINQIDNKPHSDNTLQSLENTEFDSFSEDVQQTEKQEVIEHEKTKEQTKCDPCDRFDSCILSEGQRQLCGGPF
jgi:5S rRNA maturation endonuclease (ribonuclease M5)